MASTYHLKKERGGEMTPAKMYQIANIPLECPELPTMIRDIKGCQFMPPVYLSMGKYYLIVVTHRKWWFSQAGFYHVPSKRYATWINRFVLVAQSPLSESGARCFVFECHEGTPPVDAQPFVFGEKGRKVMAPR